MEIGKVRVEGISVDAQTRCAHYHGPTDVIAIRFACCGRWFPCFECHAALAGHEAKVWPFERFSEKAVLCGSCGRELSVEEYFTCGNTCPSCSHAFNPGCANHYHLYFELEKSD